MAAPVPGAANNGTVEQAPRRVSVPMFNCSTVPASVSTVPTSVPAAPSGFRGEHPLRLLRRLGRRPRGPEHEPLIGIPANEALQGRHDHLGELPHVLLL